MPRMTFNSKIEAPCCSRVLQQQTILYRVAPSDDAGDEEKGSRGRSATPRVCVCVCAPAPTAGPPWVGMRSSPRRGVAAIDRMR